MAVIFSAGFESGTLSEFTGFNQGTPTVISTTPYAGAFCGRMDNADYLRCADWTSGTNFYVRVALRVIVTAAPTAQNFGIDLIAFEDTGFGAHGSIRLRTDATTGACGLWLRNDNGFAQVGSLFTISQNTWYIVEMHSLIADAGGIIEMRVDGTVRATLTGDTQPGSVAIQRLMLTQDGLANGQVSTVDYDAIEVRDDAYPGIPTPPVTWEQEGYQWRRDDGTEVTATAIGAQDTPL